MKCINRKKSVITKKANLEHLYTLKDFPVFFGCTHEPPEKDLKSDMIWEIDPETGIIQLRKLIPLKALWAPTTGKVRDTLDEIWNTALSFEPHDNHNFSTYVCRQSEGNIIELAGRTGPLAKETFNARMSMIEGMMNHYKEGAFKSKPVKYRLIEPNPLFAQTKRLKALKSLLKKEKWEKPNTIVFAQLYEHVYDPEEFLKEINGFVPEGGKLIFAYPNLEHGLKYKFTNIINFKHSLLMTLHHVDYFLAKAGFRIIDKTHYKSHSHFYTAEKVSAPLSHLPVENKYDHNKVLFEDFVNYHLGIVKKLTDAIKGAQGEVFIYGTHIFLEYLIRFGLDVSRIRGVLDWRAHGTLLEGKRLYGTKLMVRSPAVLKEHKAPTVIIDVNLHASQGSFLDHSDYQLSNIHSANERVKKDILHNVNSHTLFI